MRACRGPPWRTDDTLQAREEHLEPGIRHLDGASKFGGELAGRGTGALQRLHLLPHDIDDALRHCSIAKQPLQLAAALDALEVGGGGDGRGRRRLLQCSGHNAVDACAASPREQVPLVAVARCSVLGQLEGWAPRLRLENLADACHRVCRALVDHLTDSPGERCLDDGAVSRE
eukprot:6563174-Prymnesium_polylepis.2